MKKRLLITLGDCYTEGVGCYEPSVLTDEKLPRGVGKKFEVYSKSLDRFHNFGWPSVLQKRLKYDSLWNLGYWGASNSQLVKRWMELFGDDNLSKEYDVLVLWMVGLAERMSFYKKGKITSFNAMVDSASDLYYTYVKFLGDDAHKNMLLETYFYVNTIQTICKLSNYNFLYINVDHNQGTILDSLIKSSASLNLLYKTLYPHNNSILDVSGDNKSFCDHPNEQGYENIANVLYDLILQHHPHLLNNQEPPEYTMKYLGTPRQW